MKIIRYIGQIATDYWWTIPLLFLMVMVMIMSYDSMAREQCDRYVDEECVVQYVYYKRDNK